MLTGSLLLASWTVMVWAAVKLAQDLHGAVRDRRQPRRHALR
jgi:FtsZ-interacting cell division protein ZipA